MKHVKKGVNSIWNNNKHYPTRECLYLNKKVQNKKDKKNIFPSNYFSSRDRDKKAEEWFLQCIKINNDNSDNNRLSSILSNLKENKLLIKIRLYHLISLLSTFTPVKKYYLKMTISSFQSVTFTKYDKYRNENSQKH